MTKKRVLFVCTGNSCRSVMAKGLLEHQLAKSGTKPQAIEIDSAGVFAIDGMGASRETVRLLHQLGIDASTHHAKPLTDEMVKRADLVFVMELFQAEEILQKVPEVKPKVHLLKTYGVSDLSELGDPNIPDPIGKPMEVYEVCFATIQEAVERVAKSLVSA